MIEQDLFNRDFLDVDDDYTSFIKNKLNLKTLKKWSKRKTIKFYNSSYDKWYLCYRFSVLKQWFLKNINNEEMIESKLNRYIKNLMLKDFLNAYEQNYILSIANNHFTKIRNIKSLSSDFDLNKNEISFFHYFIDDFIFCKKSYKNINLYITNQRIICITKNYVLSFYYNQINNIDFSYQNKIVINYLNKKYYLLTHKQEIIKTSLKRIRKIKIYD